MYKEVMCNNIKFYTLSALKIISIIASSVLCIHQCHSLPEAATVFLWLCTLIEIAWIDGNTMTIPNQWNLALMLIGVVSMWTIPDVAVSDRLLGMAAISVPMILTDLLVPGGFGGGDIKLVAAAGLLLGWRRNLTAAMFAFAAGGIYALFLLISGKAGRKDGFAFGPFLCGGMAAALLFT